MKTKVGHRRAYPHYRKAKPAPVVVQERQFVRTVRTLLQARRVGTLNQSSLRKDFICRWGETCASRSRA